MNPIYKYLGGRKATAGLIAAILLTAMALALKADFTAYATSLLVALGLTQGTMTFEDVKRNGGNGDV